MKGLCFVLVLVLGCAGQGLETEGLETAVAAELPAPGDYQLTSPLLDCGDAHCTPLCPVISVATVEVGADGSAAVDPCPRGWACGHEGREVLGDVYSPVFPKNGHVCAYDVTQGSFGPPGF